MDRNARNDRTSQGGLAGSAGPPSIGTPDSRWHLVFAFGVVLLAAAGHSYRDAMEGMPWRATVPGSAVMVLQTVVLTLGHAWMRRRDVGRKAMIMAGIAVCAAFGVIMVRLHAELAMREPRQLALAMSLGLGVGLLWLLLFRLPAAIRDVNLRTLAAEGMRRQAELAQLRSNLQPHFLMNTLHTIAALTVDEPLVARRLLSALGDLLRDSLEPDSEIRPLETDIAWLRRYADILEVRHRGLLRFAWDVAEETTAVRLPKLLLQPLIENAAKHGALRRSDGGLVTVRARFSGDTLELVVEDNGPGMAAGAKEGLGLRIVRERAGLAHPGGTLTLESSAEGSRATIAIPHAREPRP